jgi:hypothetical protein
MEAIITRAEATTAIGMC